LIAALGAWQRRKFSAHVRAHSTSLPFSAEPVISSGDRLAKHDSPLANHRVILRALSRLSRFHGIQFTQPEVPQARQGLGCVYKPWGKMGPSRSDSSEPLQMSILE